ncbi:alpha/beta fold hydrolase [Idiomarina ramblicola]|uniref:Homoserine acetyltransferase n=1 Tax=Idiomarina ramblicola TaxID=263724 RepID=A0A432YTB7_9GAMM|nr:alpha/beta fold hydrolase [Idiomarina ramblicola]RUO64897.1 homoserine acetyltransferase [Idiomarina ramblicola]
MVQPVARSFYTDTSFGRLKGYRYGDADAPAIVVQGGISASGRLWTADESGWWQSLHPVFSDLDNVQVISFDYLGGLGGSDCPTTPLTVQQHSDAIRQALKQHTDDLQAWVGGSFGGVLGLQFAADHPAELPRLSAIGTAHKPSVHSALLRYFQQALIQRCGDEQSGIILARALAMLSYRTAEEFEQRFSHADDAFEYLLYQGEKLLKQNGNDCRSLFTHLTPILNDYSIDPAKIQAKVQLIDFLNDTIAPPSLVTELERLLPNHVGRLTIDTPFGHDGFIKNVEQYQSALTHFLTEPQLESV